MGRKKVIWSICQQTWVTSTQTLMYICNVVIIRCYPTEGARMTCHSGTVCPSTWQLPSIDRSSPLSVPSSSVWELECQFCEGQRASSLFKGINLLNPQLSSAPKNPLIIGPEPHRQHIFFSCIQYPTHASNNHTPCPSRWFWQRIQSSECCLDWFLCESRRHLMVYWHVSLSYLALKVSV